MLNPSKKNGKDIREKKKKSNRGKIMNNTIFFIYLAKHRLKIIEQGYFTIDQILTSASLAASCALQEKKN
jgi:predicted nucleic acid-binding Zn finger protein